MKKIKPFKEIMQQIIKKISNISVHLLEISNNFIDFLKNIINHIINGISEFLMKSKKPSEDLIEDVIEKIDIFDEKKEDIKSENFKPHQFIQFMEDPVDNRDILFSSRHCMSVSLSKKIDLRNLYNNRIENQGEIGSCTGQGATSLMEFVHYYLYNYQQCMYIIKKEKWKEQ